MGIVRKTPPNYGRSFECRVLIGPASEVARVEVPEPRDFLVQLGDTASEFLINRSNMPVCEIQYGNGGVGNVTQLQPSVRGSVYHVTASMVVVRAFVLQDEFQPNTGGRFSANIGFGRPSAGQFSQQIEVPPGGTTDVRLLPWTTDILVTGFEPTGIPAAATLDWLNFNSLGVSGLTTLPPLVSSYQTRQPIPYYMANVVRFDNPDVVAYHANVTQYWLV